MEYQAEVGSDILPTKEGGTIKLSTVRPSILSILGLVALLLAVPVVSAEESAGEQEPSQDILREALALVRDGYPQKAIEQLQTLVAAEPVGSPLGDRGALILGNLLLENRRPEDALSPLRRAVTNQAYTPYARLLIVRAALRGNIETIYDEAKDHALFLHTNSAGNVSPLLRREAGFLLAKLSSQREEWDEAVHYGEHFLAQPGSTNLHNEARWLVAEGLRKAGRTAEAHKRLAALWYETPGSPWAVEARQAMAQLERSSDLPPRTLSPTERYDFIKALRSAGLHDEALEELALLARLHPAHKADGALFMKAMSLHAKRQNDACVATVKELREAHPKSPWLPAAGMYAIKCLRRSDSTPEVRHWAGWLIDTYPGHEKAMEAYYNLGSYLGNVVSQEEGLKVLKSMVAVGGKHEDVRDALWKMAWLERNRGRTATAVEHLEQLLRDHPTTGYRKGALFWQARFLRPTDRERAIELYQQCVKDFPNHYYGHMAHDDLVALGVEPEQIGSLKSFPDLDDLTDPAARPNAPEQYVRAVELKSIGLYELAAAELASMAGVGRDLGLQFALAELYSLSGNTWEAAALMRRHFGDLVDSGTRDFDLVPPRFWRVVYPFNYRPEISAALEEAGLRETGIDPYLTAALIRSESRFSPSVISRAGAVGLMQMMPELADRLARERWQRDLKRSELFDPETNIRLGTYHLAKLIEGFDGDWAPAICSYNAGVGPVRSWWNKKPPEQPLVEFIENIPYVETRLYVKQILADHRNYEWIYGAASHP